MSDVTFVFEHGKTYAVHEGKVIAADADPMVVQAKVKQAGYGDYLEHGGGGGDPDEGYEGEYGPQLGGPGESQSCPGCGAPNGGTRFCPECGSPLGHGDIHGGQGMENPYPHDEPSPGLDMGGEAGSYMAKTVTTPNGLKGVVLGKVAGLWGDEVTVRLENGRIVKLPVGTALLDRKVAAAPAASAVDRLESRLNQRFAHTRADITERLSVLQTIQSQAGDLIRNGAPYAESVKLDQLSVQASVEAQECHEVLAAMEAAIPMAPPAFSMQAAKEAAGISREDASWLDHTLDEMVKQAEATDFTKLMDEGPEALAAELSDAALADKEVTREAATSFIAEKTAGITRKIAEPYMATFLTRVEECRRQELTSRQPTTHKEAAAEADQYKDLPDDALFL